MIYNAPDEIGAIALLRSDAMLVAWALWEDARLRQNRGLTETAKAALEDFYPSRFRKETVDAVAKKHGYDRLDAKTDFGFLAKLYETFFANAPFGERIACDESKLQAYSGVINKIHPYCIIGYRLQGWLNGEQIGLQEIVRYADFITPLALPMPENDKAYADLHLHAGGANENIPNIWEMLNTPTPNEYYEVSFIQKLPRLSEFSLLNSGRLTIGQVIDAAKIAIEIFKAEMSGAEKELALWRQRLRECVNDAYTSRLYSRLYLNMPIISHPLFSSSWPHRKGWLWKEALKRVEKAQYNAFWLVWHVLLFELASGSRYRLVQNAVAVFLNAVHILRAYQLMSQNTGLGRFGEFFSSKIRQVGGQKHKNIAQNIFQTGTTFAEVKVAPDAFFNGGDIKHYCRAFNAELAEKEEQNYHFSVHFVREREQTSDFNTAFLLQSPRHKRLRSKLYKEAKKLHNLLFESAETIEIRMDANKTLRYDPAHMVVTLDVAGVESQTPPEVFAPVINFLRYEPKRYAWPRAMRAHLQGRLARKRLKLSVHAGEDFNHIATGMRRIDETIEFYDMRENDRLGHALAVGLEPARWLVRNGPVYLSKEELLDTLVWLREWTYRVLPEIPGAVKLAKKYEKGIRELFAELYKGLELDYDTLYEAWKLRKYCPLISFENLKSIKPADAYYRTVMLPNKESNKNPRALYEYYHQYRTRKWEEIVRLDYHASVGFENDWKSITDEDLTLYEAIQDALLQKIADRRIIIETNPSSNVYIAMLKGYEEHPVFRWSPIEGFSEEEQKRYNRFGLRKGKVEVCINTDDPAIFPTTLYTEFLQMRHAAEKLGYHKPDIERWLEAIRQKGVEIFKFSHENFKLTG